MSWHDNYVARMNANGSTVKERYLYNQKQVISDNFSNSPSYQDVYINGSTTSTGVWITDNSETKDTKDIISQYSNPINAGDIVKWNNEYWLITVRDDMTDIYYKGYMSKCISSIKWKNSSGTDKEAFFTYKSDSSGNFGINEGRIINLGNERRSIIIQNNNDTILINKNYRFIFDDRAWKVISKDGLKDGIIYLTLEEDAITSSDNKSTRIANSNSDGAGGLW